MIDKKELMEWMHENGVTFTPERANDFLESNTHNRKLGLKKQIPQIKKDIQKGKWDDNIAKINIAKDGTISDGQNRLYSCVSTGKNIRTLVTYGVEPKAQLSTDRKGQRTLADDLEIAQFKDARSVAAIGRIEYLRSNGIKLSSIIKDGSVSSDVPDREIYDFIMENAGDIREKTKKVEKVYRGLCGLRVNKKVISVLVIEFDEINQEDAKAFWDKLKQAIPGETNDPVLVLKTRIVKMAEENKGTKINDGLQAALIIKAWNCYMKGEKIKKLTYRMGGVNPEQFPEIYNPYTYEEAEA